MPKIQFDLYDSKGHHVMVRVEVAVVPRHKEVVVLHAVRYEVETIAHDIEFDVVRVGAMKYPWQE